MNSLTQLYPLQIKPDSPTLLGKPRGIQHLLLNFKRPKLFPGPRALGLYPMTLTFIPAMLPHQEETSPVSPLVLFNIICSGGPGGKVPRW